MFKFIKDLLKPSKKSKVETVKVKADAKLITTELVLASFVSILKSMLENNIFNKKYQCVNNFIKVETKPLEDLLDLNELMEVSEKELYESKIIAFAKTYTRLQCKSKNNKFDEWIHNVSSMIYKVV